MDNNSFTGHLRPSIGNATTFVCLNLENQNGHRLKCQISKELGKLTGEIPLELGNMTSLTVLMMEVNNLNGTIPSTLGNLVNLMHLDIRDKAITGQIATNLASLHKLTYIYFANYSITGPIPPNMSKMSALTSKQLYDNNISRPILEDFGRFMPNLTIIDLVGNYFNGTLPHGLCHDGKLQWLGGDGNKFEGMVPPSLASCSNLVHFNFNKNELTSVPIGFLSKSSVENIFLQSNQLKGPLSMDLRANSQLICLALSNNSLTSDMSRLEFSQLA